jgi:hypothetical protein
MIAYSLPGVTVTATAKRDAAYSSGRVADMTHQSIAAYLKEPGNGA